MVRPRQTFVPLSESRLTQRERRRLENFSREYRLNFQPLPLSVKSPTFVGDITARWGTQKKSL